jgi:metal-responsive CopG/Arc/MetJ family transcriptional regulator
MTLENKVVLMSKRISVVLPDEIGEIVEKMAQKEMRSLSQMGAILIAEAVRERATAEDNKSLSPQKTKGAA